MSAETPEVLLMLYFSPILSENGAGHHIYQFIAGGAF